MRTLRSSTLPALALALFATVFPALETYASTYSSSPSVCSATSQLPILALTQNISQTRSPTRQDLVNLKATLSTYLPLLKILEDSSLVSSYARESTNLIGSETKTLTYLATHPHLAGSLGYDGALGAVLRDSTTLQAIFTKIRATITPTCPTLAYPAALKTAMSLASTAAQLARAHHQPLTMDYFRQAVVEYAGIKIRYASYVSSPTSALSSVSLIVGSTRPTNVCLGFSGYSPRPVHC